MAVPISAKFGGSPPYQGKHRARGKGGMSNGYWTRIYTCDASIWPCGTAARTKSAPNVALTSPHKTTMECSMGGVGKLIPLA